MAKTISENLFEGRSRLRFERYSARKMNRVNTLLIGHRQLCVGEIFRSRRIVEPASTDLLRDHFRRRRPDAFDSIRRVVGPSSRAHRPAPTHRVSRCDTPSENPNDTVARSWGSADHRQPLTQLGLKTHAGASHFRSAATRVPRGESASAQQLMGQSYHDCSCQLVVPALLSFVPGHPNVAEQ